MKRIGLSQRVEVLADRDERRDALDQRWAPLLDDLGALAMPLPNRVADAEGLIAALALDGLILTGGNDLAEAPDARDVAPERDALERAALAAMLARNRPVVGICRGLQTINVAFGGRLSRIEGHVRARHALRLAGPSPWWREDQPVNSFHDIGLFEADLAAELEVLARAEDGSIEAAAHRRLPCVGIMWHLEREAPAAAADLAFLAASLGL